MKLIWGYVNTTFKINYWYHFESLDYVYTVIISMIVRVSTDKLLAIIYVYYILSTKAIL